MDQYLLLKLCKEEFDLLRDATHSFAAEEIAAGRDELGAWIRAYATLLVPLLKQTCTHDLRMSLLALQQSVHPLMTLPKAVQALHHTLIEALRIRDKSVN